MIETTTRPPLDLETLHMLMGEAGLVLDPAKLAEVAVDEQVPQAIVRPETNQQAAEFLKYAVTNGLKVAIRGGGTKTALGNPITALDLVLSTERLNQVLEFSPADLMLGVQAGANFQEIQNQLELNGQFLPFTSPLAARATIGGAIAANTNGPARLHYGPARDWLIGINYVLPEGLLAHAGGRVVKNVAGYDMMKLYIGSLGTLGLLLDMNFKLLPLPQAGSTLIISFDNSRVACDTALKIVDTGLFPNALTVLDNRAAQALGLDAPAGGALLIAEARNTSQAVERQMRDMNKLCQQKGSRRNERMDERDSQKKLWASLTDFAYTVTAGASNSFALKAGILPDKSAELLEFAGQAARRYKLEIAALSHAAHGITYLTANYEDETSAAAFIKVVMQQAEAGQGSLTLERAPVSLKRQVGDVWGKALSEGELKIMRGIKTRLDPQNTLNPGRFVDHI